MSPGPRVNRGRRIDARAEGCYEKAREAGLNGLKLAKQGKRREALKSQAEAERWYKLYRRYGGTKPLTITTPEILAP